MADEFTEEGLTEEERDFFEAIDRNTVAEQAIFDAVGNISDEQYYTLFEVRVDHTCGPARVQVFPERAGTLYRCLNCGVAGIIGG
ncbi:MAG: hypothetical protein U0Z53_27300 [Blastocatellia bacterium]